jgi:class 3 adenylate cyclase
MSNKYIDIRIGISYDKLYYGTINNHIRIFGKGICLAARLENNAAKNNIYCCNQLYNKIIEEDYYKLFFTNNIISLKGIGIYKCYIINIKNIENKKQLND